MKKLFQTIKLRKLKTELTKDSLRQFENQEFYILYTNFTWEHVFNTVELKNRLEKNHIKPIRYIFDATDRIVILKDIQIDTEIEGE